MKHTSRSRPRRSANLLLVALMASVLAVAGGIPALGAARSVDSACPAGQVPPAGFSDTAGTAMEHEIDCVVWWGVAAGTTTTTYGPGGQVTRAQMASFVARLIEAAGGTLPSSPADAYDDDDGNVHEDAINRLAAAGVVSGTSATTYSPGLLVSRAQTASLLARAHRHLTGADLPATADHFDDDDGSPHEPAINGVAEVGIADGTGPRTFAPGHSVTRAQLAAFLARTLDVLVATGRSAPPSSNEPPAEEPPAEEPPAEEQPAEPTYASSLQPGQALASGKELRSGNGDHRFVMQGDGNLVLYYGGTARWSSRTAGHTGSRAVMQGDGNFVVYSTDGVARFATGTDGASGASLHVQNDGNVVIYKDSKAIWATNTVLTSPPPSGSTGDDYPYKTAKCHADGSTTGSCPNYDWRWNGDEWDPWGFGYRNCTSWVAWRMNETNNVTFTNWMGGGRWGNADTWDDNARALGYRVDSTPRKGAIAQTDTGSFGHVAWVLSVNADGSVTVEDYNHAGTGIYARRTVPASTYKYIHVKDL